MSKNVFLLIVLFAVSSVFADYTYVIEDGDSGSLGLEDNESLLMTGGELYHLNLNDYSMASIEGTDPLVSEGVGGIWFLGMGGYTSLEFFDGDIHRLAITSDGRAVISGGRIDQIQSYQDVALLSPVVKGDPWVPDPHITFISNVWEHDVDTNILTGLWLDGSAYNIQLINVDGFDPAIENIQFIPEPMSLILMGIGAVAIRKRRV